MSDGSRSLPKAVLWQDYYTNLKGALSSMRRMFKLRAETGLTQDRMAESLGIDKSLISRRLTGEENFTLKTLSFMATAMRCRLQIRFRPYEELGEGNNFNAEYAQRELRGINAAQPSPPNQLLGIP